MNLTNQEVLENLENSALIQELQKRIKAGTLKTKVVADEVEKTSSSLLSALGGKELLILISLTAAAALYFCYSVKITTNRVASCEVEFDQNPPVTLNSPLSENK